MNKIKKQLTVEELFRCVPPSARDWYMISIKQASNPDNKKVYQEAIVEFGEILTIKTVNRKLYISIEKIF